MGSRAPVCSNHIKVAKDAGPQPAKNTSQCALFIVSVYEGMKCSCTAGLCVVGRLVCTDTNNLKWLFKRGTGGGHDTPWYIILLVTMFAVVDGGY